MTIELNTLSIELKLDEDAIRKLGGGEGITDYLEVIGQVGEAAAKTNAPVLTGHLRRSLTHELGVSGFDQFVRIGTNVNYAIFQELGTRFHPAHPFLRPAVGAIEAFLK